VSKRIKKAIALLSLATVMGAGNASAAEYAALIEVNPGAVLISQDLDGYTVSGDGKYDEVSNGAAFMPTLGGGFEIDSGDWRIHLMAGLGLIKHDVYNADVIKYEAGVYYTGGRHSGFAIGPRVTNYMFNSPSYKGDVDLSISSTHGIAPGLAFTVGDQFVIKGSIDYLMGATFDAEYPDGTPAEDIDLDGVMVQLGVMMRFHSLY
jgi:hypothetical protein